MQHAPKHEALHRAIWGGAAAGPAPLSISRQYVVVGLRVLLLLATAAYDDAWTTDAVKATGIAMALYVCAFFLFSRRQLPLYIRLVFFLTLLSLFADVGRPLVQLRHRDSMNWVQVSLFTATVATACYGVVVNVFILYKIVVQSSTNKAHKRLQKTAQAKKQS
ncbi:hypothetical protein ACHHYP_04961 [Achlya hypogyna]|uniref:Transmembrane protein n=1 Tax=Achlya hypogyna TaxID=1202772 RepID=A0A1V9YZK1_ACHHY|nr:hypothetical protein ACHHYP_04961 [Achlya hypogyna]